MGLLLHQPLLRLRMGHVSLFHIIMKAKLSCRSSQFPWKMLEITPAMSQIMLVAPQIGRRLSFKVCCDVNGLRLETIYFLAESDQKQKFDVKSRNCFIPGSNLLKACGQNLTRELTH